MTLTDKLREHSTVATLDHSVFLDGATWAQAREIRAQIAVAKRREDSLKSDVPRLETELAGLLDVLTDSEVVFTFRALPRREFQGIVDEAPSDDATLRWNEDTFRPLLIEGACTRVIGPDIDTGGVDDAAGLEDLFGPSQMKELYGAALSLQVEAPRPFSFAASAPTHNSGQNSTGASGTTELRIASS